MAKTPDVVAKEIIAKLAQTAPGFSLELGTPERKIVDAVAEAISEAYVEQYLVGSLMDIESKAGLELEQWVGIFGFGRLQGRKATGTVRIELKNSNAQDVTIQSGSPFYTRQALPSTGTTMYFQATQAVIIPAGSTVAEVPVECTTVGSAGNIPPDTIVYVGDILGATSVTNLQSFTGGVDVETDDELRQRFKDTFLRNVSGTEDWYLGLAYQNNRVSRAACFGPIRKYATQLQATNDVNLADYLTQDIKYAWPGAGHVHVFKDLGQSTETFYQMDQDFTWLAGQVPVFTWLPGGDIAENDIIDLEFEYTTLSSRNDPARGVTNKIDLFVDGNDPYVISERTVIDDNVKLTDVDTDPLYRHNFTRVGPVYIRAASDLTNATMSDATITGGTGTAEDPYDLVLTNTPTSGTFTLSYGGQTTGALAYNSAPTVLQAALVALSTIGTSNVAVTSVLDEDGNIVPFAFKIALSVDTSELTATNIDLRNATHPVAKTDGALVTLTNAPTGGTYTLTFGAQTTGALDFDASLDTVRAALESLSNVGAGNVTVAGTPSSYAVALSPVSKIPLADNRFTRLGSTPVWSFPNVLVVDGTTYTRGVHYHLLRLAPETQNPPNDVTLMAGSIHELVGVEWESTGPQPIAPATQVPVTMTYTYNRVPEAVQAMVKTSKQLSTDVLVHQASYAYLRVYLAVEYDRGFVISQVNNQIQERLRTYFTGLPYGSWIEMSDLTLAVHQVLGVDNVTLILEGDLNAAVSNHGVQVFADSADTVPINTYNTDFKLNDNQLPVFLDAVIRRKANR